MSFSILQKRDKSYVTKVCVTKSVTKVIVPKCGPKEGRWDKKITLQLSSSKDTAARLGSKKFF